MSVTALATLHLADLNHEPRMAWPTKLDWQKIPLILRGEWPKPLPPYTVLAHATNLDDWMTRARRAPFLAIDTEYHRVTKDLHLVGVGYPGMTHSLIVDYRDSRYPLFFYDLRSVLREVPVVFQNQLADLPQLEKLGIAYSDYKFVHDLMLAHAVLWSELPHTLEFIASVTSDYQKLKHLQSTAYYLYLHGDVLATINGWQAIQRQFALDPQSHNIYLTQSCRIMPGLLKTKQRGVRVNQERVLPAYHDYTTRLEAAAQVALAGVGWPILLGSAKQVQHYCYVQQGYPVQKNKKTKTRTVAADAIAVLRSRLDPAPDLEQEERDGLDLVQILARIEQGADPILEARALYMAAQQARSHYILPLFQGVTKKTRDFRTLALHERIYPDQKIHAQASGRWSTTDPPLAQLPVDLRDIIYPDEGNVWLGWDWDQIELRINAGLTNDAPSLEAFAQGWDIHTLNACDIFNIPWPPHLAEPHTHPLAEEWRSFHHWKGKDDARRVFAKRFVYRLDYGGEPQNAGDIPGAKLLGKARAGLVRASNNYLLAHPAKAAARREIARQAQETRQVRTFMGRLRVLMGHPGDIARAAMNHPMQGGVADIFNTTFVELQQRCPWLTYVYGMHDSQWWACPRSQVVATWPILRHVVARAWIINGQSVETPATFKQACALHTDCFKKTVRVEHEGKPHDSCFI